MLPQKFELDKKAVTVIHVSRSEGIRDGYLKPLAVKLFESNGEYINSGGKKVSFEKLSQTIGPEIRPAIYTTLQTAGGLTMFNQFITDFRRMLQTNPRSKALISCSHQQEAISLKKEVEKFGLTSTVAVSDDPDSCRNLQNFRTDQRLRVLVSVRQAAEGYDCPGINFILLLSRIRAENSILQLITRGTRSDFSLPKNIEQRCFLYSLNDPLMRKILDEIRHPSDIISEIKSSDERKSSPRSLSQNLLPLCSTAIPLPPSCVDSGQPLAMAFVASELKRHGINFSEEQLDSFVENISKEQGKLLQIPILASDEEKKLRTGIEKNVRKLALLLQKEPREINGSLVRRFGKKRKNMTLEELRQCFSLVTKIIADEENKNEN